MDYCISNSDFETGTYQSSIWKGKQVLETGHPRNDVLFATESMQKEKAAKVRKFYKIPKDSRIALYAPTCREKFMHGKEWGVGFPGAAGSSAPAFWGRIYDFGQNPPQGQGEMAGGRIIPRGDQRQ